MARQVGSRNGLVGSDQVENDTPVNIPRSLARSDLKIREIDSSHCEALRCYRAARLLFSSIVQFSSLAI